MTPNRRTPGTHWRRMPLEFATDRQTLRRILAALVRRRAEAGARGVGDPLDVLTISRTVAAALALRIDLPDRAWVDITTFKLRGHLELLVRDDDGDTGSAESLALRRDAYQLLALSRTFDGTTPPLHAYELMRGLATTVRAFLTLYQARPPQPRTQEKPPR
ncbi:MULTISPECIES: hypothetical protein [unclassified Streptomyces]|uniref:hypothetical protein n=1 Tax=unclassified Streptomyces TaxID=2593676 RepID=UPI00381CFD8F